MKMLLRWYIKENRDIHKMDDYQEMTAYLFKSPGDVEKLLKTLLTAQTLWHFEAKTEEERLMAKGAANILKVMRQAHEFAEEVYDIQDKLGSAKQWRNFKKTKRTS
jgi:hypothetical protein